MGEIARSKSRVASNLKTRDSWPQTPLRYLVDVSDFFFVLLGGPEGRGSPRRQKGGGTGFLLKIPGVRGLSGERGGEGREGVCREFPGGGGVNIFFRGRNAHQGYEPECTAVAATWLRMRMRILTRPENSLANFRHQISNKKLRIRCCEGIR